MSAGRLASIILILLLICLKFSQSGVKKIKIHVPYYVKHVHHYKKVYVPKVHVIKHEHHHKKEYDHHHHHHEVQKHSPYRGHKKSSHEYPDEYHDVYYDEVESKSYRGRVKKRGKPWRMSGKRYQEWRSMEGSDYLDNIEDEEEDDYLAHPKKYYIRRRADNEDADEEQDKNTAEEEKDEDDEDVEGRKDSGAEGEEDEEEDEEDRDEDGDGEEDGEEDGDGGGGGNADGEEDGDEQESENENEQTVDSSSPLPFLKQDNSQIFITTTKRPLR